MSSRRVQNVSETYCKDGYLQKDLSRSHFWEFFVQYIELQKFLKFYFFTLLPLFMAAYRDAFRTWSNICNGTFFAKILNGFKLLTISARKASSQILERVDDRLLAKGLKYWDHSCSKPSRKYVWRHFWKDKISWCDSKKKECLCKSSRPKDFLKKM